MPRPTTRLVRSARSAVKVLASATVAVAVLAGCSKALDPLSVGLDSDHPGLAVRRTNVTVGFDADVALALADRLGYGQGRSLGVPYVSEADLGASWRSNRLDFAVALTPMTPANAKVSQLIGPYLSGGQTLAVRADDPRSRAITGPQSLAGRPVCVAGGASTMQEGAATHLPSSRIVVRSTVSTCLTMLLEGTVDAVTDERLVLEGYGTVAPYAGKLRVLEPTFTTLDYGLALPKDQPDLCRRLTRALQGFVADGEWADAYRRAFVYPGLVDKVPAAPKVTGCS